MNTVKIGRDRHVPRGLPPFRGLALLCGLGLLATLPVLGATGPARVRTFEQVGRQLDEISVPGRPPAFRAAAMAAPATNTAAGDVVLRGVPSFTWCYGCSPTAAAMILGYYDRHGFPGMYAGPANGGVCPLTNETAWGSTTWPSMTCGECPICASHSGIDGRTTPGHVEDYWIDYANTGPDPCITQHRVAHPPDCTADFMGTSQSQLGNVDGATTFIFANDGGPLNDYTNCEPAQRDGCHGLRLFAQSRGYLVAANFSQYIAGYNGNPGGFSFADYMAEIDAGRPVMLLVGDHSMVGFGYGRDQSQVHVYNTWDHSDNLMTWGGLYEGLTHYGVVVLRLQTVAISGSVASANGAGLAGCTLSRNDGGGSATTDAGGHYSLNVPAGWSGTLTPSLTNLVFVPASLSYTNLPADQATQNFAGRRPPAPPSGLRIISVRANP